MAGLADVNLTRGHKEFDSKVKNLQGIFQKLKAILNISSYEEELKQIVIAANNNPAFQKEMPFQSMQMDYESYLYDEYIPQIDALTKRVEEESLPFYELYILSSKIDDELKHIDADSIGDVIHHAKDLLDSINSIDTHNQSVQNQLIQKAYQTIYSVILYEEIFDRSDILDYMKKLDIPANRENVGRLVSKDLGNLSSMDVIDEEIQNIQKDGLGYDYLSRSFIQKLTRSVIGEKNDEYQKRKKDAIDSLKNDILFLSSEKNRAKNDLEENRKSIRKIKLSKNLLRARLLSFVLVPVTLFVSGHMIGRHVSNKITEYKTITRTIDADTGEILGDVDFIYDEHETTYVATISEYNPWRKNPNGVGYVRNVSTYEYFLPEDAPDDYHASREDINGNVREKYRFVESKDSLDLNDSMTKSVITITETYQDKNDSRKSTKYIIPGSITGLALGILIEVILVFSHILDVDEIRRRIRKLDHEIESNHLNKEEILEKLEELKREAYQLRDEYNTVVRKYGSLDTKLLVDDDSSWILEDNSIKCK